MKVQVGRFVCQITMKTIRVSLTLSRARILACLPTTPELSDSPNPALTCSECKAHLAEPWGALLPIPDPEGEESSPRPQISSRDKPTSRTVARWRLLRSRTSSLECGLQESRQSWWLGATGTGPFSGDFWNADSSCIHLKCIYLSLLVPAWQTPNHECTRGPSALWYNCCPHNSNLWSQGQNQPVLCNTPTHSTSCKPGSSASTHKRYVTWLPNSF